MLTFKKLNKANGFDEHDLLMLSRIIMHGQWLSLVIIYMLELEEI